jgi:hypothetical protein
MKVLNYILSFAFKGVFGLHIHVSDTQAIKYVNNIVKMRGALFFSFLDSAVGSNFGMLKSYYP